METSPCCFDWMVRSSAPYQSKTFWVLASLGFSPFWTKLRPPQADAPHETFITLGHRVHEPTHPPQPSSSSSSRARSDNVSLVSPRPTFRQRWASQTPTVRFNTGSSSEDAFLCTSNSHRPEPSRAELRQRPPGAPRAWLDWRQDGLQAPPGGQNQHLLVCLFFQPIL